MPRAARGEAMSPLAKTFALAVLALLSGMTAVAAPVFI